MGDAFRMCNIPVFYSFNADNDDSLASHAQRDSASILSEDQDYFRYENAKFKIYQGFSESKKSLTLATRNEKRDIAKRVLIEPPSSIHHSPDFADAFGNGVYKKGYDTPLNQHFECPHLTARKFRQAVYARLGFQTNVLEILPFRDGEDILWTEDLIPPDPTLDHLIDNPALAVSTLMAPTMFRRPKDVSNLLWNQHLFACTMTIYNLSAIASGGNKMLLEMTLPICQQFYVKEALAKEYACKTCDGTVQVTKKKLDWYMEKFGNLPKRCDQCRAK